MNQEQSLETDVSASGEVELDDLEGMAHMCMRAIKDLRSLHLMGRSKQVKSLQDINLLVEKAERTSMKYMQIEDQLKRKRMKLQENLEHCAREKDRLALKNAEMAMALDKEQKLLREMDALVNAMQGELNGCVAERGQLEKALAESRLSLERKNSATEEIRKKIEIEKEVVLSLKSRSQRNKQINKACEVSKDNYEGKLKAVQEAGLKLKKDIVEESKKQQVLLDRIGILTSKIAQLQLSNQRKQEQLAADRERNEVKENLINRYGENINILQRKTRVKSLSETTIPAHPRKFSERTDQDRAFTLNVAQKPTLATVGCGQAGTNMILTRCKQIGLFERL